MDRLAILVNEYSTLSGIMRLQLESQNPHRPIGPLLQGCAPRGAPSTRAESGVQDFLEVIEDSRAVRALCMPLLIDSNGAMGDGLTHESMAALPDEMFRFVADAGSHALPAPRLGQLLARGRNPISTPHYAPPMSRGVIPHMSPDMLERHTAISAVYMGLEDCKSCPHDSNPC